MKFNVMFIWVFRIEFSRAFSRGIFRKENCGFAKVYLKLITLYSFMYGLKHEKLYFGFPGFLFNHFPFAIRIWVFCKILIPLKKVLSYN
jgi:hypothetical protein